MLFLYFAIPLFLLIGAGWVGHVVGNWASLLVVNVGAVAYTVAMAAVTFDDPQKCIGLGVAGHQCGDQRTMFVVFALFALLLSGAAWFAGWCIGRRLAPRTEGGDPFRGASVTRAAAMLGGGILFAPLTGIGLWVLTVPGFLFVVGALATVMPKTPAVPRIAVDVLSGYLCVVLVLSLLVFGGSPGMAIFMLPGPLVLWGWLGSIWVATGGSLPPRGAPVMPGPPEIPGPPLDLSSSTPPPPARLWAP